MSREGVKLVCLLLLMLLIYSFSKNILSSGIYSFLLNHFSEISGSAIIESARSGGILNFVYVLWESGDTAYMVA